MDEKETREQQDEILKGRHGYQVVWEDKEEVALSQSKESINIWSEAQNTTSQPALQKRLHHIHRHKSSIEFIVGFIAFLVLMLLLFVNPQLFWILLILLTLTLALFMYIHRKKNAYVNNMQQNIVYLKIKNPIMTGFEFALGIGLFGILCLAVAILVFTLLLYFAASSVWGIISQYFFF